METKTFFHFTDYNEFLNELNSYKGQHYKIQRSGDVAVITFKSDNIFVACLQYIKK